MAKKVNSSAPSRKLMSRTELLERLKEDRARGRSVVFTNGCFDLLHPGHIKLLKFSKLKGDVLVVAINTDDSVRRLKGPARPILGEKDRATILSALQYVDYVTLFSEDTPIELLKLVRPDVLIKGSDYTRDKVVGHELVESYGGRVELVQLKKGISTTELVRRLAREKR